MDSRTPRWLLVAFVLVAFVAGPVSEGWADEDAKLDPSTIVDRALDKTALDFEAGRVEMRMTIEGQNGEKSKRSFEVKSKKIDGRVRTLIALTGPKELEGQSFLFVQNDGGADDVWMHVPAFSVTRRIEGSKKRGSFLGSHFTYNDLESRDLAEAEYTRKDDGTVGSHDVYVIEATPADSVDSEYGKVVAFIRKDDFAPLRFRFFDDEGERVKQLFVEKLGETDDGATFVKQMKMQSSKGGYTRIETTAMDLGAEFPDAIFNKAQLGK